MASTQILNPPYDRNQFERRVHSDSTFRLSGDLYQVTEKSVFASLLESLHDVFVPVKLPPLELSSKPIAVRDRMAVKRNPEATALAIVINLLIVMALIQFSARKTGAIVRPVAIRVVTVVDPLPPLLPRIPPQAVVMSGGGGQPTPIPVSHGNPPKLAPKPILLLTAAPKIVTRIPIQPALDIQPELKFAKAELPNIGMPNSPAPTVVASMGNGAGAGLGAGSGNGLGSGAGGNFGGGILKVGGGVSEPKVLFAPDPGFTEEARQAKVAGKVVVYLQVNQEGHPMHVRVVRGLGMGLDEKALEAVRRYKFSPAMKDGHPVAVEMNVEVNFQIL